MHSFGEGNKRQMCLAAVITPRHPHTSTSLTSQGFASAVSLSGQSTCFCCADSLSEARNYDQLVRASLAVHELVLESQVHNQCILPQE